MMYKYGVCDAEKICKKQMEWTDEEGFYEHFLCMKDWTKCDGECWKHRPKLNEFVKPFMDKLNEVLKDAV